MDLPVLVDLAYLVASALFIIGLKHLSSPATARSGNLLAAIGMLIAIVVTLLDRQIVDFTYIIAGILVGGAFGAVSARMVKMTAMPQMVGVFNGFGGGASALVATAEFFRMGHDPRAVPLNLSISIMVTMLIGAVTFSGSMIAYGKLQGLVTGRPVTYPFQKTLNALLLLAVAAIGVYEVVVVADPTAFLVFTAIALILGILSVIPIGGADMPVVISLLNSYSGLAAAAAGFVVDNKVLIVSGALVGASGIILTRIMCSAMNRSLTNVLFGAFGTGEEVAEVAGAEGRTVRDVTVEDAATVMAYAQSVVIVPGYGLAVAQAQHQARELADALQKRGVDVKYAIHPVAGRMPGHMNVLLAEANVPYDQLHDMEDINPSFDRTDVALVVGANDVVNPAARDQPGSPIYGMPILDVDHAHHIIVLKRSMRPGFAGIENELFYNPKTMMLFGDARDSLTKLTAEVKRV